MRTCSSTSASPRPAPSLLAAPPGDRAAGEALEDQLALLHGHAGAVVLDGDPHVASGSPSPSASIDRDLGLATAVHAGVVDQVGDDAGQAAAVAADDRSPRRGR